MMTSPPSPPSPPFGPPRGMNFSRRKLTQPFPPPPPRTRIFAWSIMPGPFRRLSPLPHPAGGTQENVCAETGAGQSTASGSAYLRSMDTDTPIFFAFILKLYHAINQGEESVVSPDPDIEPRFECRSTLPHQNAAGAHCLTGKALHPETFADAIAAVRRAPLPFFMCHTVAPLRCPLRSEAGARHARCSAVRCSALKYKYPSPSARSGIADAPVCGDSLS